MLKSRRLEKIVPIRMTRVDYQRLRELAKSRGYWSAGRGWNVSKAARAVLTQGLAEIDGGGQP